MKNIGVILTRFQPIHNGYLALIKKASQENDDVFKNLIELSKLKH